MQRLGHQLYPAAAVPHVLAGNGDVLQATRSPTHLVFMHGLMGSHRNFASVCTAVSGRQTVASLQAEGRKEPLKAVTNPSDCDAASGCRPNLPPAAAPRAYPCVAFDWRNHGDSAHTPDMSLDGLADDVTAFLADYASSVRSCAPAAEPLPLILVAHSMGALGLTHWMWRTHAQLWRDRIVRCGAGAVRPAAVPPEPTATAAAGSSSSSRDGTLFANAAYRVLGAVLVDTAPAARPASFQQTRHLIESLRSIPLAAMRSRSEVEAWLLKNGPPDVCTPANIWLLRYQLSNLAFAKDAAPAWRIGLREITRGLDHISWHHGGAAVAAALRQVESLAVSQGLPPPPLPPLDEFPAYYLFGATSPYDTPVSRAAVRRLFTAPCVVEMADSNHFMFMVQKRSFVDTLQRMCYAMEAAGGTL